MAYQDLREFLAVLRQHGELIDIERPIDLAYDVAKALTKSAQSNGPAMVFKNTGSEYPLLAGIYSTRSKALLAFQATEQNIFEKVLHGLDHPLPPIAHKGPAPCQEVVLTGDAIDIRRFPIPTYSPKDGGPFITPGIVVSKDPETGVPDIGHYRFQLIGRDRLGVCAQPFHRFGKHITKAERMGVKIQGAILIGTDPVLAYAAQVQTSDTTNDWDIAGGLRGAPVELVRCKTVDIDVPANTEVVIEFEVDLDTRVSEGPLGEFTGYYTPATIKPTARITAITHRRNPYFQGVVTGRPVTENHILKLIPFEASFWRQLKQQFPTVTNVSVRSSGGVQFYVVIAMQPRFAGEARQAMMAAMSSNLRPKWVIVVEPDVDVANPTEVEWAMSFRVQPAHDVFIMDGVPAGPVDPCVADDNMGAPRICSAIGIDATRPVGQPFADVADVPGWEDFPMPELDDWR